MVYFITDGTNIKIGYTSGSPMNRLKKLQIGSSQRLSLIGYIEGNKEKERELHNKFSNLRLNFKNEWFKGTEELIEFINENTIYPNIVADIIDNKIMPLLCIKSI